MGLGGDRLRIAGANVGMLVAGVRSRPRGRRLATSPFQRVSKRALDIAVSAGVLLACAPLLVLLAMAVVIDERGPIFYRARRVGHGGRPFDMIKFRKMREDPSGLSVTTLSDPRFTRIGRWLAKTKLDELPQLWNVLCGQMTLVGPRPEAPGFVEARHADYAKILAVKQGITGLSQLAFFEEMGILDVHDPIGLYESHIWPQKIALDQMYADRATLGWDLRILFWSVIGLLLRRPVAVHRTSGRLGLRRR